ncbi:MAG: polysaccharide biosynthesis tyrosine autokinase [Candidatus Omnitrophica bacterium]|nr:polysaccharide biosynthesis tyrosine autokinase [Candidatus Omnitrophota bacterium]
MFSSRHYLRVIFSRLGLIASIIALFGILAVFQFFYAPKVYRTNARFMIKEKTAVSETGRVSSNVISFLRSKDMAEKVSEQLGYPDAESLLQMTRISASREDPDIINITVEGRNPEKITGVANTWIREFMKVSTDSRVDKDFNITEIRVIDKANVPIAPTNRKMRKIIYIMMLGVVVAIGISFFLEYMDHTLRTPNGVELYAKMPYLGSIPPALQEDRQRKDINRIVEVKPQRLMAEAFRNVKVAMLFNSPGEIEMAAMIVTSSAIAEGKTFIASNLALTFARAGDPTLLIDADMQKGMLEKDYKIKTEKGLSSFLTETASLEEVIMPTDIPNLSIIPSGPYQDNPEPLLTPDKVEEIVRATKTKFKRIFIDVPSILGSNEILSWSDKCDGIIYIIGSGFTPLEDVLAAKNKILGKKARIIGSVLNNVAIENDFCYYYRYCQFYLKNKFQRPPEARGQA